MENVGNGNENGTEVSRKCTRTVAKKDKSRKTNVPTPVSQFHGSIRQFTYVNPLFLRTPAKKAETTTKSNPMCAALEIVP